MRSSFVEFPYGVPWLSSETATALLLPKLKCLTKMEKQVKTAGQTAPRTLVIFRDCHSKNNIVVTANSDREEERVRLRAMSKGFLVAVRKPRELMQNIGGTCTCTSSAHTWQKPSAIVERPRPKLCGAFQLTLTSLTKEGGAA